MLEFVGLLIFSIATTGLLFYLWTLRNIEKENIMLQSKIAEVEIVYDEMQERVDGIRKYRHDLQKHIRIVEQFLKVGNQFRSLDEYKELQGYIRKMQEDITAMQGLRYCDHDILNAIIQIKKEECDQKDIPVELCIDVHASDLAGIDPYHLTGILMNLLDNAIEAETLAGSPVKHGIMLTVRKIGEGIAIEVGNDVPAVFTPDFKTGKRDKERHGLGLDIARDYCGRYGGDLNINYNEEDNFLLISAILKPEATVSAT